MNDVVKNLRTEAARNAEMQGDRDKHTNHRRKTFRFRNHLFTDAADLIESLQGDNKRLTKMIGTWRATNDANWASLMNIAKSKIEQRDKVCALRLHTQDDEGIWYSMTDCGLSGTIGYEESSLDDGRSFCPSCGGKVVIQSLENSDE